ncbi:Retrovirus-related Pol poly from transposon [Brachionus plicatilis]|uniref:Retrovirus-related Pol poly from transposon n=1 Tax=Brachionus plicatilis TaxID=10195 RepID=A0A3M7SE23_BRAPC|nr:Retrovirus-related Pol poly from transposon [Brachionus plicatilis]
MQLFNIDEDENRVQRWEEWVARLERLMAIKAIKEDKLKQDYLFFFGGSALENVYKKYAEKEDDYEMVNGKIAGHFKSKFNAKLNVLHFRDLFQHEEEPFEDFVNRLRRKAKICAFKDENHEIALQIVHRCKSTSLKRRALEADKELSLDDLIKYGKLEESVNNQMKELKKFNENERTEVNWLNKDGKDKTKENRTYRDVSKKENNDWLMPMVTLWLSGISLGFGVDTGAHVNIMDERSFRKLRFKPRLSKVNTKLYAYGQESYIDTIGRFKTRVKYGSQYRSVEFIVTKGNYGNLLSYKTCVEMGIMAKINSVVKEPQDPMKQKIIQRYPALFSGKIGMLKDHQVDAKSQDLKAKRKMNRYNDQKLKAQVSNFKVGDIVLLKWKRSRKSDSFFDPDSFKIVKINGSMVTLERNGCVLVRNTFFIKIYIERGSDTQESLVLQDILFDKQSQVKQEQHIENNFYKAEEGEEGSGDIENAKETAEFEAGNEKCSMTDVTEQELVENKISGEIPVEESSLSREKRIVKKPIRYGDAVAHGTRAYRKQLKS